MIELITMIEISNSYDTLGNCFEDFVAVLSADSSVKNKAQFIRSANKRIAEYKLNKGAYLTKCLLDKTLKSYLNTCVKGVLDGTKDAKSFGNIYSKAALLVVKAAVGKQ